MKDILYLYSVHQLRSVRLLSPAMISVFATGRPSEWRSIGIDIPGRLGDVGDARAVLEYSGEI
jgi:hypothetical protein